MSPRLSTGFLKGLLGALFGMNAFAVFVVVLSFVLGFGTSELQWQWVRQSGLSLAVLAMLLVAVRQADRPEDGKK